jgi:hypothetical protein
MPPFNAYSHYLAYGATDQETFRELRTMNIYDGVLVPGTIAAWQRQGTGGFVLTLSATAQAPPYMIDPRFPLFQQGLRNPKQSHKALSEIFGDPDLIQTEDPTPEGFPDERLDDLAEAWVKFNRDYGRTSNEKFDKYARRLGEDILPNQASGPEATLAPYFACGGSDDPWWPKSRRLFETAQAAASGQWVLRVVCAEYSGKLDSLLADLGAEQLVVWVSGLDEHKATVDELIQYRSAIDNAAARGQEPFALYGGFFSVLLGTAGLRGQAHGIGFSEHRSWVELPTSGAAPPRFYLRRAHRYFSQDLAQRMFEQSPDLTECPCPFCNGRPPVALDYHELMKHSVWCRDEEIDHWHGRNARTAADLLEDEHDALTSAITSSALPPVLRYRALEAIEHLPIWTQALRA